MDVASRDGVAFVADAVHRDDSAILRGKPQHVGIELAHVAQLNQPVAKRLGQRLPVILCRLRSFARPATTAAKSSGSLAFNPSRNSRTGHVPASIS